MDLTREDFLLHIQYLRDDIKGVSDRLDTINGRTRVNSEDISGLKATGAAVNVQGWKAGGVGAGGSLLLFMAWEWFKSKL